MLDVRNANISEIIGTSIGTANPTIITPKNTMREILHGIINFTADATVANRYIQVWLRDPMGTADTEITQSIAVTASTSGAMNINSVYDYNTLTYHCTINPPLLVPADYQLYITILNGVAGDSYTYRFAVADYKMSAKDDKSSSRRRT